MSRAAASGLPFRRSPRGGLMADGAVEIYDVGAAAAAARRAALSRAQVYRCSANSRDDASRVRRAATVDRSAAQAVGDSRLTMRRETAIACDRRRDIDFQARGRSAPRADRSHGAGKTTFINLLTGVIHRPQRDFDEGADITTIAQRSG